jgi:hypothetical protein
MYSTIFTDYLDNWNSGLIYVNYLHTQFKYERKQTVRKNST